MNARIVPSPRASRPPLATLVLSPSAVRWCVEEASRRHIRLLATSTDTHEPLVDPQWLLDSLAQPLLYACVHQRPSCVGLWTTLSLWTAAGHVGHIATDTRPHAPEPWPWRALLLQTLARDARQPG